MFRCFINTCGCIVGTSLMLLLITLAKIKLPRLFSSSHWANPTGPTFDSFLMISHVYRQVANESNKSVCFVGYFVRKLSLAGCLLPEASRCCLIASLLLCQFTSISNHLVVNLFYHVRQELEAVGCCSAAAAAAQPPRKKNAPRLRSPET